MNSGGNRAHLTAHQGDVRFQAPHFTHDGRALLLISDQGREFMNLAVMALPAGTRLGDSGVFDGHGLANSEHRFRPRSALPAC